MIKRTITLCVLTVVVSVLSVQPPALAQETATPVLRITTIGGMCQYGACGSEFTVYSDGTAVHLQNNESKSFQVDPAEFEALLALIESTDYAEIRRHPFLGRCPVSSDGRRFTYYFQTGHGEEELDSCKQAIGQGVPLIDAAWKIYQQTWKQ